MNSWERRVVGGGRMWWNTSEWDGGVGEGCGGSSRGSRANGWRVGGVTCGWRGGTLQQRRQMPRWLDFISHRQTPQSMPTSSVWACASLWTSQPVNLHQTRCAVTLSWWVPPSLLCCFAFFHCFSFFWNLCSRAHSPLQQKGKKSHVRKREKESESETCEMKKEQRDIWLSVALLAVADVIRRDYRNTILTQITSPPLRLTAVSLSASRVGHPAVISTAGTLRDFSVYFLSLNHLYSISWSHVTRLLHEVWSTFQLLLAKIRPLPNILCYDAHIARWCTARLNCERVSG